MTTEEKTKIPVISITGGIKFKLSLDPTNMKAEMNFNNSVPNEAFILIAAKQIMDVVLQSMQGQKKSMEDKRRIMITQFELSKMFTQCADYLLKNHDTLLTKKEDVVDEPSALSVEPKDDKAE